MTSPMLDGLRLVLPPEQFETLVDAVASALADRLPPPEIDSWLDGKHIIEQTLKGNQIDVRIEVEPSRPLGIASWRTKAALRSIRLQRISQ